MADAEREKVDSNEYLFGIAKKKIDEPIFPQSVNEEENLEATKLKLDEKDIVIRNFTYSQLLKNFSN